MTDDLKSRLDRLGERTPDRSDAFERLTRVRERKQRNRRRGGLAIGLAVALVGSLVAVSALRDGGTPVPRGSDTPNVPAAWQPPEVLTIWPENSVQDATQGTSSAEDVQAAVDAGDPDLQWRLDPEQVAERFGLDFLGWPSADAHDLERGERRVTATLTPCPQAEACRPIGELQMVLVQPGRSDAGGVWGVSAVMSDDLAIEVDPMDPAAALAERSAIDVELALPENTVANVGLAAANPCAQTASMAPQLTAGTTALFVPDMEQMDPSCGDIGVGYAFAYATDEGTRPATDPFVDADRIVYPWLTIVPIYVEMISSDATATASPDPEQSPPSGQSPSPSNTIGRFPCLDTSVDMIEARSVDFVLEACNYWSSETPITLHLVVEGNAPVSLALFPAAACTSSTGCDPDRAVWRADETVNGGNEATFRVPPLEPGVYYLIDEANPESAFPEIDVS